MACTWILLSLLFAWMPQFWYVPQASSSSIGSHWDFCQYRWKMMKIFCNVWFVLVCLMEQVVPEELDEERWGPLWSLINEKKASLSRTLQKVEELLGRPVWPEISFFWKLMWAVSPAEQGQLLLIYVEKLICYSLQWLLHVQNWCILMTCFSS